jgi:hypothetical protein
MFDFMNLKRLDHCCFTTYRLRTEITYTSPVLIDQLQSHFKVTISDIFVLGCKQIDVGLAANSKLLLLRADYAINQQVYLVGIINLVADIRVFCFFC